MLVSLENGQKFTVFLAGLIVPTILDVQNFVERKRFFAYQQRYIAC